MSPGRQVPVKPLDIQSGPGWHQELRVGHTAPGSQLRAWHTAGIPRTCLKTGFPAPMSSCAQASSSPCVVHKVLQDLATSSCFVLTISTAPFTTHSCQTKQTLIKQSSLGSPCLSLNALFPPLGLQAPSDSQLHPKSPPLRSLPQPSIAHQAHSPVPCRSTWLTPILSMHHTAVLLFPSCLCN